MPNETISWDESKNCISDADYLTTDAPTTTELPTTEPTTLPPTTATPACQPPNLLCGSGSCVAVEKLCDGNLDCPGGEDEMLPECIIG